MGEILNDALIETLLKQAQKGLCRRLWSEFKEYGGLKKCPSFPEAKALVHILNTMTPFSSSYKQTRFSSQWLMERGRQRI